MAWIVERRVDVDVDPAAVGAEHAVGREVGR